MLLKILNIRFIIFLSLITSLLIFTGCSEDSPVESQVPVIKGRGEIISTAKFGTYTPEVLTIVLTLAEIEIDIVPEVTVDVIKIIYQTINYGVKKYMHPGLYLYQNLQNLCPC